MQFPCDFRMVNCVTPIMTGPILYMNNQALRLAKFSQNQMDNFKICSLPIITANIINFSWLSILQHCANCPAMVLHMNPIPDLQSIPIYR